MDADAGEWMFSAARARQDVHKLQRLLHTLDGSLRPEAVHALRTGTRRADAILQIVVSRRDGPCKRFQKGLKRVRRSAGTVRDWDVLIGLLQALPPANQPEPLRDLIEHLSRKRARAARRLHAALRRDRRNLVSGLNRLGDALAPGAARISRASWNMRTQAQAAERLRRLEQWPRLTAKTLHSFRVRAKHLRDTLHLGGSPRSRLLAEVTAVKDGLGDWHDWRVLSELAKKHPETADGPFAAQIAAAEKAKRTGALRQARAFQGFLRTVRPPHNESAIE